MPVSPSNRRQWLAMGSALISLSCAASAASTTYPSKPLRILVPYAAGGASDNIARQIAAAITGQTGQAVVVDNRPGGSGVIAVQALQAAPADGHTFAVFDPSVASMNPFLFRKLAYDPERALAPVSVLARNPIALVALPSFPAGSVRELVAHARSHGDLSYASTGNGNGTNLAMEMFLAGSAIQMVHVPYKGSAPAMQALLAGQVPVFMSDLPTVVPYARSGKVRVIAVTGDRRSPHLPDVPTFAEAGARGVEIANHFSAFVAGGTPPTVVEQLNAVLHKALADPRLQKNFSEMALEVSPSTPQQLQAMVRDDSEKYGAVIRRLNLSID